MKRGYADGPFGQVHYCDTETDGPPLVLCHQAPMTMRQFDTVYPLLAEQGIHAIGIDTPGFGLSDAPAFVPTIGDYATVVPPVLDQLGIEKAVVLGHHTGALVVTEVALQFPDRVDRVILNGPVPLSDEERQAFVQMVEEKEKGFRHVLDGSHLSTLYAGRAQWAEEGTDPALITRYVIEQLQGFAPFWYGHNAAFAYDHEATIMALKHPTLILTNTGDIIYEHAKQTHILRPDFDFIAIEGGSVDIVDQRPAEWVRAVSDYIHNGAS
ncbi:MAG: alpha/beta fold hydrolase [Pseudomonadota bacterium]